MRRNGGFGPRPTGVDRPALMSLVMEGKMGNNLNSVLIEGEVVRIDNFGPKTPNDYLNMVIESKRYFREGDEYHEDTSCFDVTVAGEQAKKCHDSLRAGIQVRIVGRLEEVQINRTDSKVYIIAEHVEFKPEKAPTRITKNADFPGMAGNPA